MKPQASTLESGGMEAGDHTGAVSASALESWGSLVWQGRPLLKAHYWYLDLVVCGGKP